jgi:hypothetical protein
MGQKETQQNIYAAKKYSTELKSVFNFLLILGLQVLMAHACNPSYSGGRDQEDGGFKAAPAK